MLIFFYLSSLPLLFVCLLLVIIIGWGIIGFCDIDELEENDGN
jgi:hypothetical protein